MAKSHVLKLIAAPETRALFVLIAQKCRAKINEKLKSFQHWPDSTDEDDMAFWIVERHLRAERDLEAVIAQDADITKLRIAAGLDEEQLNDLVGQIVWAAAK